MKILGRIAVRGPKIAGVFLPLSEGLKEGIWELVQTPLDDVPILRYVGTPYMKKERYNGIDLMGIFAEKEAAFFTEEELDSMFRHLNISPEPCEICDC